MKMYPRSGEKRRFDDIDVDDEEAAIGTLCRMSGAGGPPSPLGGAMENEKRLRREIANSNERRRMQSINAGFATLKQLLPHAEGEKLSKAAILQQTADYIYHLEGESKTLRMENQQLKKFINQHESTDGSSSDGEGQMNDILSTIQDLQNNPSVSSKLPNTEFHRQPNTKKNNKCHVVEHHRLSTSPTHHQHHLHQEIAAVEEVGMVPCNEDVCKVETSTATFLSVAPAVLNNASTNRSYQDDKIKTVMRYPNKTANMECNIVDESNSSIIKSEPIEYTTTSAPTSTNSSSNCVTLEPYHQAGGKMVMGGNGATTTTTTTRCYTINHHQNTTTNIHPGTTIVTILPPTPPHPNSMPALPIAKIGGKVNSNTGSVMEVVSSCAARRVIPGSGGMEVLLGERRVEVEPASRIPTPDEIIEYNSSGDSPSHTTSHLQQDGEQHYPSNGIIVTTCNKSNNNGQSCQKSLDTICEAIRHLEGDHMFSANEERSQVNRIEEEIITEETYAIQDSTTNVVLQDEVPYIQSNVTFGGSNSNSGSIVRHGKNGVFEICASPPSSNNASMLQSHTVQQFHPATTMVYGIGDMVSSEPQEAPLELTTNHRIERISNSPHHNTSISISGNTYSAAETFMQAGRPGVIVVKQV